MVESEGNKEEGQQDMARPPARGRPTVAKAPLQRGDHPQGQQLPAARPQGAAANGQPCRQQGRRHQPQGWPPLSRVAVVRKGQRRRRRKGGKRAKASF
ncbi:hypothetical protein GW17_00060594 [Ensete ventricosum]|nr:hypothetical protein GW17_00060594 [Ensete ventricosum]